MRRRGQLSPIAPRNWRSGPVFLLVVLLGAGPALGAATFCNDRAGLETIVQGRKEMLAKLGEGKYTELENFYGGLQKAYEAGIRTEAEAGAWFYAFHTSSNRYAPFFDEWVARYPDSYAAKLAYAHHLLAVAWDKRGKKFANETSGAQFAAQKLDLERMIDVLNRADTLTRKPIVSQWLRINMASAIAGRPVVVEMFQKAERIDPANSTAKSAFIHASQPKWGGSVAALEKIQQTAQDSALAPDLKTFVEYHVTMALAEAANLAEDRAAAIKRFERAAELCKAFQDPLERLLSLYKDDDNAAGVVSAAERYLAMNPNSGWALVKIASAQGRLKRPQDSLRNYERAAQLGERTGVEGVAWHYARGEAVARDPAKALELYEIVEARGGNVKDQIERLRRELAK